MKLDPVDLEIIGKKLSAITDEMYFAIQRSSRSSYVKEAADFSTAILDTDGNIFAYPPSATFNFLVDSHFATTIRAVPDIEPGDVIITNDPYASGALSTHLPDLHLLRPYFHEGRLVAWGWCFVHCADIGGTVASSMSPALREIYQEGLRLPPMKLVRKGEMSEDILTIIKANGRVPETTVGDLRAMLGGLGIGALRFGELVARFGIDDVLAATIDLQDYAADRARAVFRKVPDGIYDFWDYMDDDLESRIPVRIRVRMTVEDGTVHLDLTGTDPQVRTAYNVPTMGRRIYWISFRLTSFITTLDPSIPKNAGMYRHITLTSPPGTILNAEFPDAVNIRASAPWRLFDATTGALICAAPHLMPAATGGTMVPFAFAEPGVDGGSPKVEVIQPMRCGMGAFEGRDGVDARDNSLNNMRNHPIETVETSSSVIVRDYDIRCDSGGPGRWRGGVGQQITVEALIDNGFFVGRGMERLRFPPWGVRGGRPGAVLRLVYNMGRPDERDVGKIHELHMSQGDTLTVLMAGGGGYGDPFERDPAAVLEDVLDGFVSREAAERDYGVVIRAGAVDEVATAARRAGANRRAEPFDFGEDRAAWEAVFDDATMGEINRRLYALPKSARPKARRHLFETVVPALAEPDPGPLAEALAPVEATKARLATALEEILPGRGA